MLTSYPIAVSWVENERRASILLPFFRFYTVLPRLFDDSSVSSMIDPCR